MSGEIEIKTAQGVKPSRLSESNNYMVGGKNYATHRVSELQQKPNQTIKTGAFGQRLDGAGAKAETEVKASAKEKEAENDLYDSSFEQGAKDSLGTERMDSREKPRRTQITVNAVNMESQTESPVYDPMTSPSNTATNITSTRSVPTSQAQSRVMSQSQSAPASTSSVQSAQPIKTNVTVERNAALRTAVPNAPPIVAQSASVPKSFGGFLKDQIKRSAATNKATVNQIATAVTNKDVVGVARATGGTIVSGIKGVSSEVSSAAKELRDEFRAPNGKQPVTRVEASKQPVSSVNAVKVGLQTDSPVYDPMTVPTTDSSPTDRLPHREYSSLSPLAQDREERRKEEEQEEKKRKALEKGRGRRLKLPESEGKKDVPEVPITKPEGVSFPKGTAVPNNSASSFAAEYGGATSAAGGNAVFVGAGVVKTATLSKEQVVSLKAGKKGSDTPNISRSDVNMDNDQVADKAQHESNPSNEGASSVAKSVERSGEDAAKGVMTVADSKQVKTAVSHHLGAVVKYTIKTEVVKAVRTAQNKPKMSQNKSSSNSKSKSKATPFRDASSFAFYKARETLGENDDFATQSVEGVITAATTAVDTFKVAQMATEAAPTVVKRGIKTVTKGVKIGVKTIKTVGNGVYQVATTTGLATITVAKTAQVLIQNQIAPISKAGIQMLKHQAIMSGLSGTVIAKGIVNNVERVKTAARKTIGAVVHVKNKVKSGVTVVKKAAVASVRIVRGIANGTLTASVAKQYFARFRNRMIRGIKRNAGKIAKKTAVVVAKGAKKGAVAVVKKGIPGAWKLSGKALTGFATGMASSEDDTVRGVGNMVLTTRVATKVVVKTAVVATKMTGRTVKTGVNTVKTVKKGIQYAKKNGFKKSVQAAGKKAANAVAKAGKSVVSAVINAVRALGAKVIIPLVIVICCVVVTAASLGAFAMVIGSIFGGSFETGDTNVTFDVQEYLSDADNGVPALSQAFKQELADKMQEAEDNGYIVRFYSNTGDDGVIAPTLENVSAVFWEDEELVSMIQPMFSAILLMEYDLTPTEAEAKDTLEDLFNGLFIVEENLSVEYCGQSLWDGSGTANEPDACGRIHAKENCPNFIEGTHESFVCSTCCEYYYTCYGHAYQGAVNCGLTAHTHTTSCESLDCDNSDTDHTHDASCYTRTCGMTEHIHSPWYSVSYPGCYGTSYYYHYGELTYDCGNSTKYFRCNGYKYCEGHEVMSFKLNLDGIYALEAKYFTDPINELAGLVSPTEEQTVQLQNLKDYYEIYLEYVKLIGEQYGDLGTSDFDNVIFVNGTRTGNDEVVTLAKSQVGQQGGQPYWSYYGFASRVEWCACFVHWCMRNTPSATDSYPNTSNNAYCQTVANYFIDAGQWGDKNCTDLVAGDVIFFDWQQDGHTDHIGIVVGHDGTYVYTVEGNSGDAVKTKKYEIGSSVIYGYGLLNY